MNFNKMYKRHPMRFIAAIFYVSRVVLSLDYIKGTTLDSFGASNKTQSQHDAHFILFTNGKCEDCITYEKELDNVVESVSRALKASPSPDIASKSLVVGKVDIREHPQVADSLDVRGVPTLMLVNDYEEIVEYSGAIESEPLTKWLSKYLDNIISAKLTKDEEIAKFVASHEVSIIAELPEEDLEPFSHSIRGLRQLVTYAWIPINAKEKKRRLVLNKRGLSQPTVFSVEGDLKTEETQEIISNWIQDNQIPFLGAIDLSNLDAYLHKVQPMIWYVGDQKGRDEFSGIASSLFQNSMEEFKREFWWVWLDPDSSLTHSDFVKHYLKPKSLPSVLITDLDGAGRFQLDLDQVDITTDSIKDWIKKVLDGSETRELMSAPIPQKAQNADGTERLVTSTIKEWLNKVNNKALLLIIESVWCTQCGNILTYLKDTNRLKSRSHCLSIGRIESSTNELDPYWNLSVVPGMILMKQQAFSGNIKGIEKHTFDKPFDDVNSFWQWIEENTGCNDNSQPLPKKVEL